MTREEAEMWNGLAQQGLTYLEKFLSHIVGLAERNTAALERSADAQERIADRLDNMHAGYIDVRVVQDHD